MAGTQSAAPRPAAPASHGVRHEAEEAAVFKLISRDPWDRRRRSITLAACKMQRHGTARITGRSARDGRGAATLRRAGASSGRDTGGGWYFRYRPVPGWLATVRSGFCGPDCAAHHRRRRFHLQALTSDGSSRPGPEAVRRGKQRPEACSPALVSWWRAKVHAGGYPTRVC